MNKRALAKIIQTILFALGVTAISISYIYKTTSASGSKDYLYWLGCGIVLLLAGFLYYYNTTHRRVKRKTFYKL